MSNYREKLSQPFPIEWLDFRPGGYGVALVYVEVWRYLDLLDQIAPGDYEVYPSQVLASHEGQVSLQVGIRVGDETFYGESDLGPATKSWAQAVKRGCAKHGLGRYLYDAPNLTNAFDKNDLKVDKSVLIARCYEAWGLDLPEGFEVVESRPTARADASRRSDPPRQSRSRGDDEGGQDPSLHKGKLTERQCKKLYSLGITDADISAMSTQDARKAVDDAFNGSTADEIRSRYVKQPASAGRRAW